uniref:Uncharacterized protein n=1 Tax=Anguilla anguilla TaxID=7936 RepID=A0A0E9TGE7_ANGAN
MSVPIFHHLSGIRPSGCLEVLLQPYPWSSAPICAL